jgi:hypothetical protein
MDPKLGHPTVLVWCDVCIKLYYLACLQTEPGLEMSYKCTTGDRLVLHAEALAKEGGKLIGRGTVNITPETINTVCVRGFVAVS